ncbi:MAG: hypothetical protein AB7P31_15045 [Steroidobacteraceae bacterium]
MSAAAVALTPRVLRESVLVDFASEALHVPPRPVALDALLRREDDDIAAMAVADAVFVVAGRDREAKLLHDGALATRRKALAVARHLRASAQTVGVAALLHRAGEACALRALARAETGTQVRLDSPSRAELCARHQSQFTEQLLGAWALPPPVVEALRGWRRFRETSSLAAAIVYYAHLLASEELHPEFFAPGLVRTVGAELGIDSTQLEAIG